MKDIVKALEFEQPEIKKVKGHTRIELTSVKTGEKKVIESDNLFQVGVLSKQLRSFGKYNNSPWLNDNWDSAARWIPLVGGIFLFKDAIDTTNGEVEYMPAGNEMVGNGSYGVTNAATPVELGTYNSIESSAGASSVTIVYDWGTSQGNGTIGCICLTSNVGGLIGYGNKSGDFVPQNSDIVLNSDSWQNLKGRDAVPYNNIAYRFTVDNTAKTVQVEKMLSAITVGSIFEKRTPVVVNLTYQNAVSAYGNYFRTWYLGNGKFALMGCGSSNSSEDSRHFIAQGASYSFLIYDSSDDSLTTKTITNDSGYDLFLTSGNEVFAGCLNNDKIVFPVGSLSETNYFSRIVVFDLSTGHAVKTIPFPVEEVGADLNKYGFLKFISDDGDLLAMSNYIFDLQNDTCYPTNGAFSGTYHWDYDALLYNAGQPVNTGVDNMSRNMNKNPIYLATINNLQTPVVKDNTQTMKVIYTLTEA